MLPACLNMAERSKRRRAKSNSRKPESRPSGFLAFRLLCHKLISLLEVEHAASLFCVLGFAMSLLVLPAEGRGVGTSGSAVLRIGIGAKSSGMGEASVAVADDVSSIYWNPAGLVQIRDSQLSAMHIEWLDDIRYEWVGLAQPLASWATIAADVSYLHMGSVARTIESLTEGYEEDGTFTASDVAGRLALAGTVSRDIRVGASFQVLQSKVGFQNVTKESIEDKTAQSTAIGLGCLYNTPIPNLSLGCSLQNWGRQTRAFEVEKEPLPFAFRLGAAYKAEALAGAGRRTVPPEEEETVESSKPVDVLIVAMDLNFPADNSVSVRMGTEYRFGSGIAIRGGYRTGTGFDFPSGLCGGAGYSAAAYQVDYALVPYGSLGGTHRVSFTIRF